MQDEKWINQGVLGALSTHFYSNIKAKKKTTK